MMRVNSGGDTARGRSGRQVDGEGRKSGSQVPDHAFAKVGKSDGARFPKAVACNARWPRVSHAWVALLLASSPSVGQAADIIKGAELYRQHCANCHGTNGRPLMVGATDFSQPTALLKPDMNLLQFIRDGKGAMPAYQGLLRDRDLLDIVAHLRTLR